MIPESYQVYLQVHAHVVAFGGLPDSYAHCFTPLHLRRHWVRQQTERTSEQLDAALRYVETMGWMTEEATEFPARLNPNCIYCDHKQGCPAYVEALAGKREDICEDLDDPGRRRFSSKRTRS